MKYDYATKTYKGWQYAFAKNNDVTKKDEQILLDYIDNFGMNERILAGDLKTKTSKYFEKLI